ncbi:MAG: hypothetical protein J3K34DRAFT_255398 [Monoraphidium minutum]|nr:MAG: hypothetical protein J3K34DRAFT_255398 [Monoraphidium minutum]
MAATTYFAVPLANFALIGGQLVFSSFAQNRPAAHACDDKAAASAAMRGEIRRHVEKPYSAGTRVDGGRGTASRAGGAARAGAARRRRTCSALIPMALCLALALHVTAGAPAQPPPPAPPAGRRVERAAHFYQGDSCHPSFQCPTPGCHFPGLQSYGGSPPDNCSFWETGRFKWDRLTDGAWRPPALGAGAPGGAAGRPPPCASTDVAGQFVGDVWHGRQGGGGNGSGGGGGGGGGGGNSSGAAPTCGFRWFSPKEALDCLAGKRVVFSGDSLVRQLRHRLITYLRGFPVMVERTYHAHSSYAYYANGSWDRFDAPAPLHLERPVPRSLAAVDAGARSNGGGGGGMGPRDVRLDFLWATSELDAGLIEALRPDVLVAGVHYWVRDERQQLPAQLDGVIARTPGLSQVLWMTTPPNKLSSMADWDAKRRRRNSLMREWAAGGGAGGAAKGRDKEGVAKEAAGGRRVARGVLPADKLADAGKYQRMQKDKMHFGCHFEGFVESFPRIDMARWRRPAGGDCRDLLDLNLAMLLLNAACPAAPRAPPRAPAAAAAAGAPGARPAAAPARVAPAAAVVSASAAPAAVVAPKAGAREEAQARQAAGGAEGEKAEARQPQRQGDGPGGAEPLRREAQGWRHGGQHEQAPRHHQGHAARSAGAEQQAARVQEAMRRRLQDDAPEGGQVPPGGHV